MTPLLGAMGASCDRLPEETIALVFALLGEDATAADVVPLAVVCRRFVEPAREAMVRNVVLRRGVTARGFRGMLLASGELGRRVESTTAEFDDEEADMILPIAQILALTTHLRHFDIAHRTKERVGPPFLEDDLCPALSLISSLVHVRIEYLGDDRMADDNEDEDEAELFNLDEATMLIAHAARQSVERLSLEGFNEDFASMSQIGPWPVLHTLDAMRADWAIVAEIVKHAPALRHLHHFSLSGVLDDIDDHRAARLVSLIDCDARGGPNSPLKPDEVGRLKAVRFVSLAAGWFVTASDFAALSPTIERLVVSWFGDVQSCAAFMAWLEDGASLPRLTTLTFNLCCSRDTSKEEALIRSVAKIRGIKLIKLVANASGVKFIET